MLLVLCFFEYEILKIFSSTASVVSEYQLDAERTVALDTFFGLEQGKRRVVMCSVATLPEWRDAAEALFSVDESPVTVINDSAGFIAWLQRL